MKINKLTLTIFLSISFLLQVDAQEVQQLYKDVSSSVVTILTKSKSLKNNYQVTTDNGLGSGVLISDKGEILTAAHVVNNAEKIEVKFLNGEVILAKVIRSSSMADIALIKLSWMPKEYKVAKLGDSDKVEIGQKVVVIGAPFGLEHSLSVGYISRRQEQKTRTSGFTLTEFFQTDASINQGNSGGPMFNLKGEVIGISSYIVSRSGGFQGLGFAVTTNIAKKLVIDGKRRWTGIQGYLLDKNTAWMLNVPMNGGMLIESVVQFSPADIAGLKGGFQKVILNNKEVILGGDIILSVNGVPMTSEAIEKLSAATPDNPSFLEKKVYEVEVLRGGRIQKFKIEFDD